MGNKQKARNVKQDNNTMMHASHISV